MVRLPVPGQDPEIWGKLLNNFLLTEHNLDGSLRLRNDGTLQEKEDKNNKSADGTLGASDTLYPTQSAVKAYVDGTAAAMRAVIDARVAKTGSAMSGPLYIAHNGDTTTKLDITTAAPGGSTPLTTPLAYLRASNSTYDQWVLGIENYGLMTSVEIKDWAQKNYHENGIGVQSEVDQLKSVIQQGYVNFRLKTPGSTADVVEIDNEGTGISLFINNNNNGQALQTLHDFFNKNKSQPVIFIDDYSRTNDGNTYTRTGSTFFIRHRAQELNGGSITDSSAVLQVHKENINATGPVVDLRQYGNGRGLALLNNGTKESLYLDVNGDASGIFVDSESTTKSSLFVSAQNIQGSAAYILSENVHTASADGANLRLQMNNTLSTAPNVRAINKGSGQNILIDTDSDADSIFIDSEAATKTPLFISAQNTSGSVVYILDEGIHGTGGFGAMVRLQMNNSSSTAPVINIDNNGSGRAIAIDHDDTGTNPSLDIDRDGNSANLVTALKVDVSNIGGGGTLAAAFSGGPLAMNIQRIIQLADPVSLQDATTKNYVDTKIAAVSTGPGTGDVNGPASAIDNALVRFNAGSGKLLQDSSVTLDDNGAITGLRQSSILDSNGNVALGINAIASADSYFRFSNAVAGSVTLDIVSSASNAGALFRTKGNGTHAMRPGANSTSSFTAQRQDGTAVLTVDSTNVRVAAGIGAPTSTLETKGSFATAISARAANYTLGHNDCTLLGDATSGPLTITLPLSNGISGRRYTIKKIDSTGNLITIATSGSQTIDGSAAQQLVNPWQSITVQSDGSNWFILANI